jgi:hypothetical protein
MLVVDPNLFSIMSTPASLAALNGGTMKLPLYYTIVNVFFSVITIFLSLFVSAGLISTSLKKSKFYLGELVENAKSRYWKFFGFCIVTIIFILLLTLLLIIPGIIFAIYWTFAAYVFFDRKEKIIPSLKQSKAIVKNRWWKTLGYLLLMGLILIGVLLLINIIQLPVLMITMFKMIGGTSLSLGLLIASSILSFITGLIGSLISPMSVLFIKNFYQEVKK